MTSWSLLPRICKKKPNNKTLPQLRRPSQPKKLKRRRRRSQPRRRKRRRRSPRRRIRRTPRIRRPTIRRKARMIRRKEARSPRRRLRSRIFQWMPLPSRPTLQLSPMLPRTPSQLCQSSTTRLSPQRSHSRKPSHSRLTQWAPWSRTKSLPSRMLPSLPPRRRPMSEALQLVHDVPTQ